ncbi:MAG: sterol desaturase family protein [Elusimicrobia bacterium]|nr:sterol desaturase family protein [Elusimicrobiota bacterium]
MDEHKQRSVPSIRSQMALYEAAIRPAPRPVTRALWRAWTVLGISALLWAGWCEPWSALLVEKLAAAGGDRRLLDWGLVPLVYGLRAVLLVEAFGYAYHRFFQHLGWFTRRAQVFRRNQMFHWIHHMILYPIGRFYRRPVDYVASEPGIAWSWVAPALLTLAANFLSKGFTVGSISFVIAIALYAKEIIDKTHSRFHETDHPWADKDYFHWLEEIHILHHWDQRYNFTFVHPAMDWLFGTYLSPATHRQELTTALIDVDLTASDLINWRYLLIEASPAEYAAFISQARRHPRSLRKLGKLRELIAARVDLYPNDALARKLKQRAAELWHVVGPATQAAG